MPGAGGTLSCLQNILCAVINFLVPKKSNESFSKAGFEGIQKSPDFHWWVSAVTLSLEMTETIKWQDLIKKKLQTNQSTNQPTTPEKSQETRKSTKKIPKIDYVCGILLLCWVSLNTQPLLPKVSMNWSPSTQSHTKTSEKKCCYCCCRYKPFKSCPGISKTTLKVRVAALTDESSPSLCSAYSLLCRGQQHHYQGPLWARDVRYMFILYNLIKQETKFIL